MKNEINLNKVIKEKLKNPNYRIDYLKEYVYRNLDKNQNDIYNDFNQNYGDIEYDYSFSSEGNRKTLIFNFKKNKNKIKKGKVKIFQMKIKNLKIIKI